MHIVENEQRPDAGQDARRSSLPDNGHGANQSELDALLEDLVAIHVELSQGVMPRAARITGTGHQLAQTVARLEAAIRTTKELLVDSRRSAADPPSSPRAKRSLAASGNSIAR